MFRNWNSSNDAQLAHVLPTPCARSNAHLHAEAVAAWLPIKALSGHNCLQCQVQTVSVNNPCRQFTQNLLLALYGYTFQSVTTSSGWRDAIFAESRYYGEQLLLMRI